MEQKEDIQRAMSRSPSDSEMMELRAALHAVTSKLYSASGKAKVQGLLPRRLPVVSTHATIAVPLTP